MANLNDVLRQLREEHKQAQQQVEKLDEAISVISGVVGQFENKQLPTKRSSRAACFLERWLSWNGFKEP
jgi:hypothetical protein